MRKTPSFKQLEREFINTVFSSITESLQTTVSGDPTNTEFQKEFIRDILHRGLILRRCKRLRYDPSEVAERIIIHVTMDHNDLDWWIENGS